MKEAAGEANITVITIVLIGVVAAAGLLLVPRLIKNASIRACCTDYGWIVKNNRCCKDEACSNSLSFASLRNEGFMKNSAGGAARKALAKCIYGN